MRIIMQIHDDRDAILHLHPIRIAEENRIGANLPFASKYVHGLVFRIIRLTGLFITR